MRMIERLRGKLRRTIASKDSGYIIQDEALLKAYEINSNFPRLVSFPRTGSHWLRMLMELYFEKPSLVYVFYQKNPKEFTCIHKHDIKLKMPYVNNVVYLLRDPVDTMFSFMKYHKKSIDDQQYLEESTILYAQHVEKWVLNYDSFENRTIITYEALKDNPSKEFGKICDHLATEFDQERFLSIYNGVNKEKIGKRTKHSSQILNKTKDYDSNRDTFKEKYEVPIMTWFHSVNDKLKDYY